MEECCVSREIGEVECVCVFGGGYVCVEGGGGGS